MGDWFTSETIALFLTFLGGALLGVLGKSANAAIKKKRANIYFRMNEEELKDDYRSTLKNIEDLKKQWSREFKEQEQSKSNQEELTRLKRRQKKKVSERKEVSLQPHFKENGTSSNKVRVNPYPIKATPPLREPFMREFWGSSFVIGGVKLFTNLNNGRHRFEIIKNQAYLDGKPHQVNGGDLARIKEVVQETRI